MDDPTKRFSSRVEHYVCYRPSYPWALVKTLETLGALQPGTTVADVGAGTGLLAERFLEAGYPVIGVEPNAPMREAGERYLAPFPAYRTVDGRAEATGLPDESVGLITAGQAFHWFEPDGARREFARILQPGGWVALVWNSRSLDGSPFLRDYEALLREYGVDYQAVTQLDKSEAELLAWLGRSGQRLTFPNDQRFGWEGLRGRALSSSYVPPAGHPSHEPFLQALRALFEQHREDGQVRLLYTTELYVGQLGAG